MPLFAKRRARFRLNLRPSSTSLIAMSDMSRGFAEFQPPHHAQQLTKRQDLVIFSYHLLRREKRAR
jgi:hypothetical protein